MRPPTWEQLTYGKRICSDTFSLYEVGLCKQRQKFKYGMRDRKCIILTESLMWKKLNTFPSSWQLQCEDDTNLRMPCFTLRVKREHSDDIIGDPCIPLHFTKYITENPY